MTPDLTPLTLRNDPKAMNEYAERDAATSNKKTPLYAGFSGRWGFFDWSGRQDLNLRPPVPQTDALPSCATARDQAITAMAVER